MVNRGVLVRLAVFVVVCLLAAGALATTIGNIDYRDPFGRNTYPIAALFDDVTGLVKGDNVKVAGVVVGKVTSIQLRDGRARVGLRVKKSHRLPADTTASIRWRNLLGQRYVYLYPGNAPTTLRSDALITKTRSVVDLGELFNRLGPIVKAIDPAQVNTFLDAVVAGLDGNTEAVRAALADLGKLTSTLASRDEAIGRILENVSTLSEALVSRDQQIATTLENLVTLAKTFSANTGTIETAFVEVGKVSKDLAALLAANRTQVDSIIGDLVQVLALVRAKNPQLTTVLDGLYEVARGLFATSRYGEWLNQVIPCGKVTLTPTQTVEVPCATVQAIDDLPLPTLPTDQILSPVFGGSAAAAGARSGAAQRPAVPGLTSLPGAPTPGQATTGVQAIQQLLALSFPAEGIAR